MAEMRPQDVPLEYVDIAADTIHAHYAANPDDESEENAIRILLAAVLPLHENQMRERIVDQLRRRAHDAAVADVNGYSCDAAVTWMAAATGVEEDFRG